jgi:hypothetical protein
MTMLTDAPTRRPPAPIGAEDPSMDPPTSEPRPGTYPAATRVEVRNRYDGSWGRGFEVAEVTEEGYRIRRASDDSILPTEFDATEVRKERGRSNWWV